MADLVGERYELLAVVARGDEWEVLRALDHLSGRPVVLQVRHLVSAGELDALVSEALVLLDVERHPNLPLVREGFLLDDSYYLVMDWTEGLGLHRVLESEGLPGLPFERVIEYLIQVAGALEHLHHQKSPVVHHNLQAANLVLTGDGRVVLVGFGISSRWGIARPPLSKPPTPASDVYSLAVTAHTLLTGSPPRPGAVPRFSGLSDAEAEGVARALRRGLDADPARRPTSPSALVEEIRAGASTLMLPPEEDSALSVVEVEESVAEEEEPAAPEEPAAVEVAPQRGSEGRGSPTTTDLWPLEEEGIPLHSRPAPPTPAPPTTADLWAFAAMRVRSRPLEQERTPLHSLPAVDVEAHVEPERSRTDRAARSSRLRGGLAAVLVVLVGVTLLQVRSARAERNQFRRLQLASVAQALAAQVDGELTAGHHERAALLARQADLFDRQTGATVPEVDRALRAALTAPNFSRVVTTAKGGLWSVALSPDGTKLATSSSAVRLIDLRVPHAPAVALSGHIGTIASVAFSPDGKTLATGGDDPTVRLWDLSSPGAAPALLEGHTDRLTSLAFGFAGQRLATASRDGTVRLWDLGTTPPAASVLSGHTGAVTAVAFSADGARLASGGADGQVRVWDVVQPAAVATLPAGAGVAAVAFSPDGRYVATGGEDRLVRLWDLGQPEATPRMLAGHGGPVSALAFSADGNTLASGSEDKTVRLWPLAGEAAPVLTGHAGPVSSVAFSPDGETLASASADGTARLWRLGEPSAARALRANPNVDTAVLADLVCQEVGRNLTPTEWNDFVGPGIAYRPTCPDLPPG